MFGIDPLMLGLVVLRSAAAFHKRWAVKPSRWLAIGVAAALTIVGFVIQILPGFEQVNGEIVALLLPVNVGLGHGHCSINAPRPYVR